MRERVINKYGEFRAPIAKNTGKHFFGGNRTSPQVMFYPGGWGPAARIVAPRTGAWIETLLKGVNEVRQREADPVGDNGGGDEFESKG